MATLATIIENIASALAEISVANGYNTDLLAPIVYTVDISNQTSGPVIGVAPVAEGLIIVDDTSDIRYSQEIEIVGFVRNKTLGGPLTDIDNLTEDIKKVILAPVTLGTGGLGLYYIDADTMVYQEKAYVHLIYQLVYVESGLIGPSAPGTEVYGSTDVFKDAIDKIYDLLNTLKTLMAAVDPTYSYLYKEHTIANLQLNGVTVGLADTNAETVAGSGVTLQVADHVMTLSVRVHTAYPEGNMDRLTNDCLLNSIQSYLLSNIDLGDGFFIDGIIGAEPAAQFEDSQTLGGELFLNVRVLEDYTQ